MYPNVVRELRVPEEYQVAGFQRGSGREYLLQRRVTVTGNLDPHGAPGAEFAVSHAALYGLTPDHQAIYQYTGNGTTWQQVGGPATHIYAGGNRLLAIAPGADDVYQLTPAGGWQRIGSAGAEFVVNDSAVYGLTPDRQAIYRYTGSGTTWQQVGGPASHIYTGPSSGDQILATAPGNGDVHLYHASTNSWQRIGLPGAQFAFSGGMIYGLTPDHGSVWVYSYGTTWLKASHDDAIQSIVPCP